MSYILAEYIWIDGSKPTASVRSKTKVLSGLSLNKLEDIPVWGFDGSSTEQAEGRFSDCALKPVRVFDDPMRGKPHILVLCEVLNADGTVHSSNTRARLESLEKATKDQDPWFGIEQEYTLFKGSQPLGFPTFGYPGPQGPYYCGIGGDKAFGRDIAEDHMIMSLEAGLKISGINAEVMPGQWEFQIGPTGPLETADQIWVGRWLLSRIAEEMEVTVSFSPKPLDGDWNGAGAHTNFSTKAMREEGGIQAVNQACEKLKLKHKEHIDVYGAGNERRLTGKHETAPITEFRYGVSDRGASIRIPMATSQQGKGYLEDRRPAANCDPYEVVAKILETVCF